MEEWIVGQFVLNIQELGLQRPWYWDIFLEELNDTHHGMHLGVGTGARRCGEPGGRGITS